MSLDKILICFESLNLCRMPCVFPCSYLLKLLANEGYLIISVPYNVTFDHAQAAKEIYERFHACFNRISTSGLPSANLTATEFVHLPLYSVGHR